MIYAPVRPLFALRGDPWFIGIIEDHQARALDEGEARDLCKLVSCVPLQPEYDRDAGHWTVRIDGRHLLPYERSLVAELANARSAARYDGAELLEAGRGLAELVEHFARKKAPDASEAALKRWMKAVWRWRKTRGAASAAGGEPQKASANASPEGSSADEPSQEARRG